MLKTILDSKTWKLFCSLKLTIVLASAITLITIGGSLLIPFNPRFCRDGQHAAWSLD